ncbi:AfsR/SARP family transcriptional regulator [Streptomyces adustus]
MSAQGMHLELLGSFRFTCCGSTVALPLGAQRLLAFLALQRNGIHRGVAAEQLWPDCLPSRAGANLRTALCQCRHAHAQAVVVSTSQGLVLSPSVDVDLHHMRNRAHQIVSGAAPLPDDYDETVGDLSDELLPGWFDEWLTLERECWDQMRLHALESLAQQFQTAERYALALQTALAAIAIDPVRETAHRILIETHVAEGNVACAILRFRQYKSFLQQELGVLPSPHMLAVINDIASMQTGPNGPTTHPEDGDGCRNNAVRGDHLMDSRTPNWRDITDTVDR